jgi:hypothetical protein
MVSPLLVFSQLGQDSLTINNINIQVVSDGNLEQMKDAALNKYLNYTTQLWLSATDASGSLMRCRAAIPAERGRDFQPGPISNDPNARKHLQSRMEDQ